MLKKILLGTFIIVGSFVIKYLYDIHYNYNFETISAGKVYKSGVIPPDKLPAYIQKYHIKSVVDLRFPGTQDLVNNPEIPTELLAEKNTIAKLKGVNYYNNGSDQTPAPHNLSYFFKIMDNPKNYPVLIHCYHGVGRAELYSALYRIEYEGWQNDEARKATRWMVKFSNFDLGKSKGDYLHNYQKRNTQK